VSGWEQLAVLVAGMAAGTMNTIVGSGTLITFPVLVLLGVPPLTANVSNTVGLVPGSVSGAIGYRRELVGQWPTARALAAAGGVGGLLGGVLLLSLPSATFDAIVPVLILLALAGVLAQPHLAATLARRRALQTGADRPSADPPTEAPTDVPTEAPIESPTDSSSRSSWPLRLGVGFTGIYGGYFGAAQGVILLAMLGIAMPDDLQRNNAVKNVVAAVVNGVAAILFIVVADVDWHIALLVALGSVVGGQVGARVGRRLSPPTLRTVIVVVGLLAVVRLLWPQ